MSEYSATFKRCINQACDFFRIKPGEFARQRGLRDFLLDVAGRNLSAEDVAALALEQLCERPPGPMDGVVCVAVMDFLDESLGKPQQDRTRQRRASDLRGLLGSGSTTAESFREWIAAWYH